MQDSLEFHHSRFDPTALAAGRGTGRVSVCIPARDEAATVGAIVGAVRRDLTAEGGGVDLVDEIVVVDDSSADDTAMAARRAGAEVVPASPHRAGKGQAMALGVESTKGDLVVFLDADVEGFASHFVTGLVGPLIEDRAVQLVKAFYARPIAGQPSGGGRVTELVARPVIELLFPELSHVRQPLAGETAVRRAVLDELVLDAGYGVELGLLIDVARRHGVASIAQVDLGSRAHRNRSLDELRPQAVDVLGAALRRAGLLGDRA